MFKRSDQNFLALLDDPVKLEERIQQCGRTRRTRRTSGITGTVMADFVFGHVLRKLRDDKSIVTP